MLEEMDLLFYGQGDRAHGLCGGSVVVLGIVEVSWSIVVGTKERVHTVIMLNRVKEKSRG